MMEEDWQPQPASSHMCTHHDTRTLSLASIHASIARPIEAAAMATMACPRGPNMGVAHEVEAAASTGMAERGATRSKALRRAG